LLLSFCISLPAPLGAFLVAWLSVTGAK